jgi:hypothetical protein
MQELCLCEFIDVQDHILFNTYIKNIKLTRFQTIAVRTALEREPARRTSELNRVSFLLRERQMQLDR